MSKCEVEDCSRPVKYKKPRELCNRHYMRIWRYGDPDICKPRGKFRTSPRLPCLTEACKNESKARGLCSGCYMRTWRAKGPFGKPMTIPSPLLPSVHSFYDDPWLD